MAAHTLSILKPSVNNLSTRIFIRAAGLEFEELDVWGKKSTPEFLAKDPADLTPLLEEEGLPKGALWESCAIMQYLCNKHSLDQFYPTPAAVDPYAPVITDITTDSFCGLRRFLDHAVAVGLVGPVKWQFVGPVTLGVALALTAMSGSEPPHRASAAPG